MTSFRDPTGPSNGIESHPSCFSFVLILLLVFLLLLFLLCNVDVDEEEKVGTVVHTNNASAGIIASLVQYSDSEDENDDNEDKGNITKSTTASKYSHVLIP